MCRLPNVLVTAARRRTASAARADAMVARVSTGRSRPRLPRGRRHVASEGCPPLRKPCVKTPPRGGTKAYRPRLSSARAACSSVVRTAAAERSMAVEMRTRRLSRPSASDALSSGRGGFTGPASLSLSMVNGTARRHQPGPLMTLAARQTEQPSVSPVRLLFRRPLALLSLVPTELSMFIAGGVAGAIAKTTTAPLDRVSAAAAALPTCARRRARRHSPRAPAGQDSAASLFRECAVRCRQGGCQGRPDLHVHRDRQD